MSNLNLVVLRLRRASEGYPGVAVVAALRSALGASVADDQERAALAAMLAAWLLDAEEGGQSPPIDDAFVERFERALRGRAH